MSYDLAKTQFLITKGPFVTTITAYRRKRALMLFDKNDRPVRPITWDNWREFRTKWPKEVEAEKLSVKTVWTLEAIKP
ncbi:hypothetical protein [Neorhizobium galegae]|uniref:Uncharacterized protein n=1 Tax=Neorhizobium galegae bv. orientalis str. HAMBI 540 TaxID=1028800 RepID=A0A068SP46_NEOGA|nr:hypothetical protein [Neorhizobium galegae]MCQ1856327.1 hypothetical protein [Neorhizobium galegae]CDN47541.1 Hypothetical protein RG540_CH13610 [Neorhizobium galegae bv. orientalis str. HAMBI 540]